MASLREVVEKAKTYVAQSEKNEAWRKRCRSSNSDHNEKPKRQKQPEVKIDLYTDKKIDDFEIATKVRQQISKWQRGQSDTYLKGLKEHEHFEIKLHPSAQAALASDKLDSVTLSCLTCNKSIPVGIRQNSGSCVLSNWTRHVKTCRPAKVQGKGNQITINKFLSTSKLQPTVLCDQPTPTTGAQDAPKDENTKDTVDSDNANKSPKDFPSAPPTTSDSVGGAEEEMLDCQESDKVPTTDWSRKSRKQLSTLKIATDPAQTKITDFFEIIDQIESISRSNPEFNNILQEACKNQQQRQLASHNFTSMKSFSPLLTQLLTNATANVDKTIPQAKRHNAIIKKFSTSLLIYAGPRAYNFLHENMPQALPSLRTIQRVVQSEYKHIGEGEFRFDDLVVHLESYGAQKVVAIAEDATRVIARADYDYETDRVVGFVLPCNDAGLPLSDTFLATSLSAIEKMFASCELAKYAYAYVAQPVCLNVPPFCFACIGSNNRFTAEDVLQRWKYIYSQCSARGIRVVSFGADGDTRELKAMKTACKLFNSQSIDQKLFRMSPSSSLKPLKHPDNWKWFRAKYSTSIAYVQDPVHVAVKLKTRMTKPSIVLPIGRYLAGIHHLQLVMTSFPKDQHGLRIRDINHKDKQNFEAVMRITHPTFLKVLQQIPDAQGTFEFLHVLRCIVDSYLDEKITPLQRIHKAWYAVFFCRCWRKWIKSNKEYSIQNNFITENSYSCIELNAHSLIIQLLTACKSGYNFLPWLYGSQSCEKLFRTLRSMSSTFSTVVNFGMLGLLRRLHRLQIQFHLETSSHDTGIVYPLSKTCKQNAKHKDDPENEDLTDITDQDILAVVWDAKNKVHAVVKELGMWEEAMVNDDDDDDWQTQECSIADTEEAIMDNAVFENNSTSEQEYLGEIIYDQQEYNDVQQEINQLKEEKIINNKLHVKLNQISKMSFTRIKTDSVSMFEIKDDKDNSKTLPSKSRLLEIEHNGKRMFIHKTTAVWLFQEGERVSADRLFRVREIQPYATNSEVISSCEDSKPAVATKLPELEVGNICVFLKKRGDSIWQIGRVLQFAYYLERTKKARQYKATTVNIKENLGKVGVLCSWFVKTKEGIYTLGYNESDLDMTSHKFCPISCYICTLSSESFATTETIVGNDVVEGILPVKVNKMKLITIKSFSLTSEAAQQIQNLTLHKEVNVQDNCDFSGTKSTVNTITIADDVEAKTTGLESGKQNMVWLQYGCYVLTKQHKTILYGGSLLDDIHIGAAQFMISTQFPTIGGLQNTVLLVPSRVKQIKPLTTSSLQILHVAGTVGHWIVLSTIDCSNHEVKIYDSLYNSINEDTQIVIAALLKSKCFHISMHMMNMAKQYGGTECGLYAIATMVCLAFGDDPTTVVFDQSMLRSHLGECYTKKHLEPFPVIKKRRTMQKVINEQQCAIYCMCRLPDHYGSMMIQCDQCENWFHTTCITSDTLSQGPQSQNSKWYCLNCQH